MNNFELSVHHGNIAGWVRVNFDYRDENGLLVKTTKEACINRDLRRIGPESGFFDLREANDLRYVFEFMAPKSLTFLDAKVFTSLDGSSNTMFGCYHNKSENNNEIL